MAVPARRVNGRLATCPLIVGARSSHTLTSVSMRLDTSKELCFAIRPSVFPVCKEVSHRSCVVSADADYPSVYTSVSDVIVASARLSMIDFTLDECLYAYRLRKSLELRTPLGTSCSAVRMSEKSKWSEYLYASAGYMTDE